MALIFFLAVAAILPALSAGIDNGLGLTPPMGWRSWNCFHGDVTQEKMQAVMDKVAERRRTVDGEPTSLLDVGYSDVGLDDNWQACGKGVHNSFHDADGNPLINTQRFPDMKGMTDYAHKLGLTAGWYMNNCICGEHQFKGVDIEKHMRGDASAVAKYGFDGVKLDGCSQFLNLTWWAELLNATGRPIAIENCHWGQTTPGHHGSSEEALAFASQTTSPRANRMHHGVLEEDLLVNPQQTDGPCTGLTTPSDCPYNFFRTSGDISASWDRVTANLQSAVPFLGEPPLARPGTWAYPDMLEVGNLKNYEEDRAHFGMWCIISAPLILGFDLTNDEITDRIWDVITNKEAIAVNQAWAGHPGRQVKTWGGSSEEGELEGGPGKVQLWAKPVGKGHVAVFVFNGGGDAITADIALLMDLGLEGQAAVRDIWSRRDIGTASGTFITDRISSHDSRFYVFRSSGRSGFGTAAGESIVI